MNKNLILIADGVIQFKVLHQGRSINAPIKFAKVNRNIRSMVYVIRAIHVICNL